MQQYKVDTIINGHLGIRQIFNKRTKAQKYILEKYKAFSSIDKFYISSVHYNNWGVYKKIENEMCIDSMNVQTKDLIICVKLSQV